MRSFDMRRSLVILAVLAAIGSWDGHAVHAESEIDRLRDALRHAISQTRALEDQQVALQARKIESDRELEGLKSEISEARSAIKAAEKERGDAVNEFNRRLDERNDVLEKWKSAYEEAASVARAKDAERAKFESESKSFKASAKNCAARNIKLVEIGNHLLERIDGVELGDIVAGHEPVIGFKRVEIQTFLRDYQDKILEQRASQ
jgi:chromosome segregation ATPase